MTDVEAGGATVFPYVGARVMPKKVGKQIHRWSVHFGAQIKTIYYECETSFGFPFLLII